MKPIELCQLVAVAAYFLIILMGQMVGIPFIFWLVGTVFDFGNIDQLFALLAIAGLVIIVKNRNKNRTLQILWLDLLCFFLLAAPLIGRLTAVPLAIFNYSGFIIPIGVFVLGYLVSLVFSYKEYLAFRREQM